MLTDMKTKNSILNRFTLLQSQFYSIKKNCRRHYRLFWNIKENFFAKFKQNQRRILILIFVIWASVEEGVPPIWAWKLFFLKLIFSGSRNSFLGSLSSFIFPCDLQRALLFQLFRFCFSFHITFIYFLFMHVTTFSNSFSTCKFSFSNWLLNVAE